MGLVSVLWGIVAMAWMVLALIPLAGITNWLLIPLAAIGAIIAAIGILFTSSSKRGRARTGLILNSIAMLVAIGASCLAAESCKRFGSCRDKKKAFSKLCCGAS